MSGANGEINYDRINDYGAVRISLASPDEIRSWSFGEVKKPETINYRTYRPEKDGLFCEKIFGPEKDWECSCGKYRGMKYKGMVCDRCGVKVTHSRVRRKRMGHIELAAPVVHIWFFKAMPSRLGTLLDMKTTSLEKVIYFQDYVVLDPGKHGEGDKPALKERQLLTEEEYRKAREQLGDDFVAEMGAEAIEKLLSKLDLVQLSKDLRAALEAELAKGRKRTVEEIEEIEEKGGNAKPGKVSKQKLRDLVKRLKVVEALRDSGIGGPQNKSEWMVLKAIPVIPPDLRPLVLLDSGNFATSDLNDLYRRIINRNNRLKKLVDLNAPEVIIRNEKRMLQQSVDALFDNNRCKRPVLGSSNRPLKSLTDMIKGKQGRFRENLLGKRVDYSARSVIVVGPELKLHQCGLPKKIALELFQPFIIRRLKELGHADTIKSAKKMLERKDDQVWDILEEVIKNHPVLLNRAPTLHRMGIQGFEPVLIEGNAIRIHPLVCKGFNADFDGDQMAVHLPLSIEAQVEATVLMMSTNNIFSPANGQPIISPSQDIVMGCYYLTAARGMDKPGVTGVERYEPANNLKAVRFALDEPCETGEGMVFSSVKEVFLAWQAHKLGTHARVRVRLPMAHIVVGDAGDSRFKHGQLVTREEFDAEAARLREAKRTLPTIAEAHAKKFISDVRIDKDKMKTEEVPRQSNGIINTTVGRIIFNDILNPKMAFYDVAMTSKQLARVISDCYLLLGRRETIELLDRMKELGFRESTRSGLSFATDDLKTPTNKFPVLAAAQAEVDTLQTVFENGDITERERYNKVIDLWTKARDAITEAMMRDLKNDRRENKPYLNPIYLMAYSGARGGIEQIRQLCGMRGLMAKPNGTIIETPIKANFREGLSVLEYFSSTHGARKGLADTALKTADSGYLTRKLADVAQNVVITLHDCKTNQGISKSALYKGDEVERPLSEVIRGRVVLHEITDPVSNEVVAAANEMLTVEAARKIERMGIDKVMIRSPMNCKAQLGICRLCYGMDLATGAMVEEGMAVGIIAAQSIGEPGTQLTMRTFHIGGVAKRDLGDSDAKAKKDGVVKLERINDVVNEKNERVALSRGTGEIQILVNNRTMETYAIPHGAILHVQNGQQIKAGQLLAKWDPHVVPYIAEQAGKARLVEIVEGQTLNKERDNTTNTETWVIREHKGDLHPRVEIENETGQIIGAIHLPERAFLVVRDGQKLSAGTLIARLAREALGAQDITGGLPRVTEIFEARTPRNAAQLARIPGVVRLGEKKRGKRTIYIQPINELGQPVPGASEEEHIAPGNMPVRVQQGERVKAGDQLVAGPLVPGDILSILGVNAVQSYLVDEVQKVYRSQRVEIDDKHIEIIVAQMLRKVQVKQGGDTGLLPGSQLDRGEFERRNEHLTKNCVKVKSKGDSTRLIEGQAVTKEVFEEERARMEDAGKTPPTKTKVERATMSVQLLGITKAAVSSESFISAASFQETTKVLTEAALQGKVDELVGLKENVILGHLIPAGTGFESHQNAEVKLHAAPHHADEAAVVEAAS